MQSLLLDLSAGFVFFAILLVTGNIYLATGVGIAIGAAIVAWTWVRVRHVALMQWFGLGLVVVMGGVTIVTHEPRFVMFKPTVLQATLGLATLRPGWINRYMPQTYQETVPPRLIAGIGWVYTGLLFGFAAINAAVALLATQKLWAAYNAVVPTVVFSAVGLTVVVLLRRAARRAQPSPRQSEASIA